MSQIIPKPVFEKLESGYFTLVPETAITVTPGSSEVLDIGQYLADILKPVTSFALQVTPGSPGTQPKSISLVLESTDSSLGQEGYQLEVSPDGIRLSAPAPAGLFRGIQSMRQLFPAEIETNFPLSVECVIPALIIRDWPRYPWRGAMLDVARHFFTLEDVKTYIDWLALYKLNIFHLHLTDDQGWRLMIHSWPRLTEYGGSTQVGGGLGGFYTQEEYTEIVDYARQRYMTVVPEIDVPGHTHAAMAAYPELTCDGVAPGHFTGTSGVVSALCTSQPLAYHFLDDVIHELAAITPGAYIHIGGDESPISESNPEEYNNFIKKAQSIIRSCGKKFIGWDETATAQLEDGAIIQHWIATPSRHPYARLAVEKGAKIILSPSNRTYLDMKYDAATPIGQTYAGYNDVQHAYVWDPSMEVDGVTEKDILGIEAPLWTEMVPDLTSAGLMAFPRLPGVAEIGWSPASTRVWNEYRLRLAAQALRWKALGINYYPSSQVPW